MTTCNHPPARLFSWFAFDGTMCIGCCECGKVLAGNAANNEDDKENES